MNSRPIQAAISTDALRHNLGVLRQRSGDAKIWAVVKANAYGHGIANVFEGLRGADGFACLDLSEAQLLRSLGWRGLILLLEGAFNARDLELCSRLNLWHVIHTEAQIDWLAAHKTNEPQRVFLKLNSGMNRLGFAPADYRAAYARLSALPQVAEVSHLTHFSDADGDSEAAHAKVAAQLKQFEETTQDLDGEGSLANSAAALRQCIQSGGDWIRAGLALYGAAPDYDPRNPAQSRTGWGLQHVMTLSSRIVSIQHVAAGQSVGYGSAFTADAAMRIGTVACGYADGYPRHAVDSPVLVCGQRTHTLGRISMDMLAVDLTQIPEADFGAPVTLWGEGLDVDEVATAAGTISYELLCAVAPRVPFVVID
jgi:alanine racemase